MIIMRKPVGGLRAVMCPFCGLTTMTLKTRRSPKIRSCTNPECKLSFFYYRKDYYIRLDDIQLLAHNVKNTIMLLLQKSMVKE